MQDEQANRLQEILDQTASERRWLKSEEIEEGLRILFENAIRHHWAEAQRKVVQQGEKTA